MDAFGNYVPVANQKFQREKPDTDFIRKLCFSENFIGSWNDREPTTSPESNTLRSTLSHLSKLTHRKPPYQIQDQWTRIVHPVKTIP